MPVPTIYEEKGFDRNHRKLEPDAVLSFLQRWVSFLVTSLIASIWYLQEMPS